MTGGYNNVYLDTSALIALVDKNDKNHKIAVTFTKNFLSSGNNFILGKHVLIEFIDGLTKRIGKKEGLIALDDIMKSAFVHIVWENKIDWDKAIEYFKKYNDKKIDLTDCLSFAIMERLNIIKVFTFDSDFKTHGFTLLP